MTAGIKNGVGLPPELFASAFPFHLALDRDLNILQVGRSWARLAPDVCRGTSFHASFRIAYPDAIADFEHLCHASQFLFILELTDRQARLRGQFVHLPEPDILVFLGSPWLSELAEITRLGLTFSDFALHDPVADLLQVVQSQTMALSDTRKLADRLAAQRTELRVANAALQAEITQRAAAQVAASEREMKFSTLLEAASEAIIIVNESGVIVLSNPQAEKLFGYERNELIGKPVEWLMPDAARKRHVAHRMAYMNAPHTRPMGGGLTLTGRRKDGAEIPLEISLSAIETNAGTLVMSFITNVAERRRASEELQSQRDFALQVMSAMGQGLTVTDADSRFEYVNQAFAHMLGYDAQRLIGCDPREFVAAVDHQKLIRIGEALRAGEPAAEEITLITASGAESPALTTCVPRQRDGKYLGAIAVITDLTERKQIELALEWARDRALEASRLKSEFIASVSHEIRTPLNSIIGVAEMLAATPLDSQQRQLASIIQESGDTLLALINDILDFSKIEAGKLMLEQRPFSLQQCIEHTVELIAPRAAEKGLELGCLIEDDVPAWISGDEGRLKQILLNLLGNAVKFTERGEIVVTVRRVDGSDSEDDTSPALIVSVRDTGIGIPIERQQRLFHPFTQVDASTTRKYGGTGLGLAISRRLCEAMGGKIWVESNGTMGATFRFTIPANPAPTPDQSPLEHPALTGRQLMIVMGSFGTGAQWRSAALYAMRFGMQVRIAETVKEALDWHATGQPIDVMLADHRLFAADATMNGSPLNGHTWPLLLLAPVNYRPGNTPETTVGYVLQPVRQAQFRDALVRVFEPAFAAQPPPWTATAAFDENLAARLPLEILVVEDNPVNQFVIRRLLQRFGYTVVTAESGARCLELCTNSRFDLIFMDMQMPGMDGLETTRRLRAMLKAKGVAKDGPAIVALTANVGPEDRAACLNAGMDDFLSKPVQVAALRTMLELVSVQRVGITAHSKNPATR